MTNVPQKRTAELEASGAGLTHITGRCYGMRLQGDAPVEFERYLWSPERKSTGADSVLGIQYRAINELPEVEEFWVGSGDGPEQKSRLALFREPEGFGVKIECRGRGVFRVRKSEIAVEWITGASSAAHYFFTYAMPLWLEWRGIIVLHGSAVSFGQRAVGFVGESGAGKSTLCDALVNLGGAFVADDGLAIGEDDHGGWQCYSGPPLFRLWPSALLHRPMLRFEELPRVHEGLEKRIKPLSLHEPDGERLSRPLDSIFLLERGASTLDGIQIVPCTGSESLVKLVEASLAYAPITALGWAEPRFRRLGRMAERVDVKRLIYPEGEGWWERLRETILGELAL